jgi:hypothetical protein
MSYWKKLVDFLVGPGDGVRARDSKGHYKADDKSTASVNEAYKDGKKPKSRAKKKATTKKGRGRPKGSKNKKK